MAATPGSAAAPGAAQAAGKPGHWEQGAGGAVAPTQNAPTGHATPSALPLRGGQYDPGGAVQGAHARAPAAAKVPPPQGAASLRPLQEKPSGQRKASAVGEGEPPAEALAVEEAE